MSEEAKKEALEFVGNHRTSHLATVEGDQPVVRVMEIVRIDDDFSIWYATGASSNKIRQIRSCPNVCITVCEAHTDLRVFGKAEVVDDREIKNQLWQDEWNQYWPKGKEDPEYILIKVSPEKVEYRDMEKYGTEPKII